MKNCDYILVKLKDIGCVFKPMYKEDLEKWFIEAEVKKKDCLFIDDFEEFDSEYPKSWEFKYIIIKGEIVRPKEERIITKLTL